jgi:hypothetical protein
LFLRNLETGEELQGAQDVATLVYSITHRTIFSLRAAKKNFFPFYLRAARILSTFTESSFPSLSALGQRRNDFTTP